MPAKTLTTNRKLKLLVAGDTAYVFHAGDERIAVQKLVLIGANCDVDTFQCTEQQWNNKVNPALKVVGSKIVDCRTDTRED